MEPYQPTVHCMEATGPPYDSCFDTFMRMPVSDGDTQFGGNTPRLSKVALPKRMTDSKIDQKFDNILALIKAYRLSQMSHHH